jgi:predicted DCC family thiol-disulfide oxidoreductase YuxK
MMSQQPKAVENAIILFDGVCNFCNQWVNLVIQYDRKGRFQFASLQSEVAKSILTKHAVDTIDQDSVVLIEGDQVYTRSAAILRILRHMDGWWKWLYLFVIIPRPLRDLGYRWFAKNRYRFFGKREECMIPTPEMRKRFLDLDQGR